MTEQINKTTQKRAGSLPQNQSKKSSQNRRKRNRSEFSTNNQSQKPFYQKKNKDDGNDFFWLYGEGDLKKHLELLAVSEEKFSQKGTVIETAKGKLRERIRSRGGNAVIDLSVDRGDTWGYGFSAHTAAIFTASGHAALVVPKSLDETEKSALKAQFEEAFKPEPPPVQEPVKQEEPKEEDPPYILFAKGGALVLGLFAFLYLLSCT